MQTEIADNPLLTEHFPIQFGAIKAEDVEPSIHLLLEQMKNRLADLGKQEIPRTYSNIVLGLEQMTAPLDFAMAIVRHLETVATTPEWRAAHNAVQEPVSMFYTSIALDPQLWEAVKTVNQIGEAKDLAPVHKRYLEKTVTGFRRAGADLDAEGKKKL